MHLRHTLYFLLFLFLLACGEDEKQNTPKGTLQLSSVKVGSENLNLTDFTQNDDIPVNQTISINFSAAVDVRTTHAITLSDATGEIEFDLDFANDNKTLIVEPDAALPTNTVITLGISDEIAGAEQEVFAGIEIEFTTIAGSFAASAIVIDGQTATSSNRVKDVDLTPSIEVTFPIAVNPATVNNTTVRLISNITAPTLNFIFSDGNKKVTITSTSALEHLYRYSLNLTSEITGANNETLTPYLKVFYTEVDPTPKMPLLANDEDDDNDNTNDLLSVVQKQTFKYFWDYAEPTSGMARERNGAAYVTSGGSGFGIMALIVGIERNFISQSEGLARMNKIVTFLETSDRFHGAWPHWMHSNGDVWPFSPNDNGGDLVETAFLVEGLITFRQYLTTNSIADGYNLVDRINTLWQGVEWDWYRRSNQNVLYWHWSPDKEWTMNMQISGWNEAMIVYVLAASSTTHTIPKTVYTNGWARNGAMRNGNSYEGITLPLGFASGGPLFFTHYSFLGLDPRNLNDEYANYWTQNQNHTLINYRYSVRNPRNFVGYSDASWGLTASDNHEGYSAHSPTNDLGVITPTAALSSFPYTPTESMKALKFFYYTMGDRLWGDYGFYDAYNITENWYANSYLAIDQGPIIVMIENYRTGLLWDLFMSAPEIQAGLDKLDINY